MWQCENCGLVIKADIPLPVFCSCRSPDTQVTQETAGRESWEQLHRHVYVDADISSKWYNESWKVNVLDSGCQCRQKLTDIERQIPPDFSSREAFIMFGFKLHNAVNAKLDKSQFSFDDARKLYGW